MKLAVAKEDEKKASKERKNERKQILMPKCTGSVNEVDVFTPHGAHLPASSAAAHLSLPWPAE